MGHKGKILILISFGVLASFVIGLPSFAYGNLAGLAVWKTVGSLVTVLLSGIVAYTLSRKEVSADARS